MSLDVDAIAGEMLGAVKGVVKKQWPATRVYFESEAKAYAARLAEIARLVADGSIDEKRARQHLAFQNESWQTTLLAVDGLNRLLVEEALNAATKVIRDTVNTAAGFALL